MKKFITYTFILLFLIYPFSYSISNGTYFICGILLMTFLIFIANKITKKYKYSIKKIQRFYPIIIVILALLTRVISALILNDNIQQVSDFNRALKISDTLDFSATYYRLFPHWIILPKIMNIIFNIFGSSQIVALIFNAVVCTTVSILIYFVTNEITDNKNVSFLASIIYIIWPANILYIGVYTTEHIVQMLLLIGILFIYRGNKEDVKLKKVIYFFVAGVSFGLTTFFKNFGIVFIIALLIYFILKIIFGNKESVKQHIIVYLISFILVIIGYFITTQIMYMYIDSLVGAKVSRNNMAYFLTVGLSSKNDGTFSETISEDYKNSIENNNYNYEFVNKDMLNKLKEDVKNNNKLFQLINSKAKIIVKNDEERVKFVSRMAKQNGSVKCEKFIENNIIKINNFYYITIFTLVGVGLLRFIKDKNLEVLYMYICVYGCYLLLLLIEAQNRYPYGINPFVCILATMGFEYLMKSSEIVKNNKDTGK